MLVLLLLLLLLLSFQCFKRDSSVLGDFEPCVKKVRGKKIKFDAVKRLFNQGLHTKRGQFHSSVLLRNGVKYNGCIFNIRVWSEARLVASLLHC